MIKLLSPFVGNIVQIFLLFAEILLGTPSQFDIFQYLYCGWQICVVQSSLNSMEEVENDKLPYNHDSFWIYLLACFS